MTVVDQYVDVSKKWFAAQVTLSQNWVEARQGLDQFKPGLIWGKTVDTYQASVQETLDAEVASTRIWFEEVMPLNDLPQPAVDLMKQMQGMTEKVTETQQVFADNWFDLLRKVDGKSLSLAVVEGEQKKLAPKAAKKA